LAGILFNLAAKLLRGKIKEVEKKVLQLLAPPEVIPY
jgi:hypothetical protein